MSLPRLSLRDYIEYAPFLQRLPAVYVVDEMCVVTFSGYVHKPHRVLKPAEEFRGRQWHVRIADGIAASVEQRAVEDIGISERESQGNPCATGETAEVDLLRVDRVLRHGVLCRKQCQGLTAIHGMSVVA